MVYLVNRGFKLTPSQSSVSFKLKNTRVISNKLTVIIPGLETEYVSYVLESIRKVLKTRVLRVPRAGCLK